MGSVAVVICNYNKKDFVLDCINSVLNSNFKDFDLVVVDNASTDGSVDAIRVRFDNKLTLIVNDENTGGSGGFKRGMDFAIAKGYRYIHLLDNDVIVDTNALGTLYDLMERRCDVGACGSLILKAHDKNVIQEYGANICLKEFDLSLLFKDHPYANELPKELECDYVAACSAMYRTEALLKAGTMDIGYFIYWDDIALSKAIRNEGFLVCAVADSIVWHYGAAKGRTNFSRYYVFRNKIHYFVKYLSDYEFENYYNFLVLRLFRMFAVNRHNPEILCTYFNALDDALNNVRGQADTQKILPDVKNERKWLDEKQIIDVSHVLDVGTYNHEYVYRDRYENLLINKDDFDFVKRLDEFYVFFKDIFNVYIKCKIDKLRGALRDE